MNWLYLTLPLAVVLSVLHPKAWIALDVKRIQANGAEDTLGRTWHRHRLSWRILNALMITLLGVFPMLATGFPALSMAAALLVWQGAWWTYDFNTRLNLARDLPYVGKYHVSWSENAAAFPDRWVWQRALKQAPRYASKDEVVRVAADLLQELLFWCLFGGSLLAGALAGAALWLAYV